MAIAALSAAFEPINADAAMRAGIGEQAAVRFCLPLGVLARLRLVACGWKNPGDKFKLATDAAWWKRPHDLPNTFWPTLGTWVDLCEAGNVGGNWAFNQAIADGDPTALSSELAGAEDDLRAIELAKADVCLPFLPANKRGVLPSGNTACLARIGVGKEIDKQKPLVDEIITIFGVSLPWWAWLALGYVVSRQLHRR